MLPGRLPTSHTFLLLLLQAQEPGWLCEHRYYLVLINNPHGEGQCLWISKLGKT